MSVSQKTVSVSGKMTGLRFVFTTETRSRETMSIWAHWDARSPLRSCFPLCAGSHKKSPSEKTSISAFCHRAPLNHVYPDVAKETPDLYFHVGELVGGGVSDNFPGVSPTDNTTTSRQELCRDSVFPPTITLMYDWFKNEPRGTKFNH
jgi:hypothetical protein